MGEEFVQVAVRVRPLLLKEVLHRHTMCVRGVPGSSQVMLCADKLFSFDHAFGPTASQDEVYETCVQPLVEYLLDGHNATVFCYGQTGSGKTYTLGGMKLDEEGGIIERVAEDVFLLLEQKRTRSDGLRATVRVSYMELYRETLQDLLVLNNNQKVLQIRDDEKGNTVVVGAKEMDVTSAEELLSVLEMGNALRHTASTGMNEHSSRSHAILTLQLTQCCADNKSVSSSKLSLVDLAGSERAGKTGNTGNQLEESVYINTGLLALGNVIRALGDPRRNRHGSHSTYIPFRNAKITRLLRDSLGGTAHTLMMACVSPSNRSLAETLSVLQFASKARHIRNSPGVTATHTQVKSFLKTWDPREARLTDLELEVKTLRELLKDTETDIARERKDGRAGEGNSFTQPSQEKMSNLDKKLNQKETSQYRLLAQEAAELLAEISVPTPSHSFRQRLQEWQDRLTAVNHSHQADDKDCSERGDGNSSNVTIKKLREELCEYKEALALEKQLLEQRDAELRQVQKEVEKLLQENKTHLQALEEERERTRIQTEQLVEQHILINRLRGELMAFRSVTSRARVESGASWNSGRRPQSVPLIRHSCGQGPRRRIHSSPPAYSLERVMAAFKMRGHLLLTEIEEKDEVYCPFIKQQAESKGMDHEKQKQEEDVLVGRMGLRPSLNRTWTSRQKKSALKEKKTAPKQTSNRNPAVQEPQGAAGNDEKSTKQRQMRKARLRASVTQRRIQDLTVNMRMKEELIKELNKTDKETRAVDRHVRHSSDDSDVLMRLSMQRQKVQAETYHSLQHMRLQRAQLQSSLGELDQVHGSSWLEEEEERVLQKRAELQELEEEMKRREEVLLRRETCLQEKNKLEIKKLRSSQALSQDLLHVSMQLESLEEEVRRRSSVKKNEGITREELEKERETLRKRKDTLDEQLKDNIVLTVEEEHSLLELEEAIEALDAELEFKNRSIQDKQKKLSITDSSAHQSQSTEPAQLCDVITKLKKLSPPEALDLLVKYFNKVVYLREVEHRLRLHCEELQIHAGEQEVVVREMKVAMQRLTLDADRRFTQQHRDHQSNIQLLLQKLKEGGPGEAQQAFQDRLQHLEKELFFYKSSSRQLKKKLRDLQSDALHSADQPTRSRESRPTPTSANKPQTHSQEVQSKTHIVTTYAKIHSEETDQQTQNKSHLESYSWQTSYASSFSDLQVCRNTKMPEYQKQTESQGQRDSGAGHSGGCLEMEPVRLCRKELRQISPADLKVSGSATWRRQSVLDTSSDSILEDSIEVAKNTDR
ncbi:kinesin-like protein KIF27 [Tautogolabrus adspersus]